MVKSLGVETNSLIKPEEVSQVIKQQEPDLVVGFVRAFIILGA